MKYLWLLFFILINSYAHGSNDLTKHQEPFQKTPPNNIPPELKDLELVENRSFTLPLLKDRVGQLIAALDPREEVIFYSSGLRNVSSSLTSICHIDGENCLLFYRDLPIEKIIHYPYPQVAHFLIHGTGLNEPLKNPQCLPLPGSLLEFCTTLPSTIDPIIFLQQGLLCLDKQEYTIDEIRGYFPTLFSYSYRHQKGLSYIVPLNDLSYSENVLYMMFGETFLFDPKRSVKEKELNMLLNLHAEHSTNASTFTMINLTTYGSSYPQCLNAALSALSGPKHGGANLAAYKMFSQKIKTPENLPAFIQKVLGKEEDIMGMGHRIYNGPDPRYKILYNRVASFSQDMGIIPTPLVTLATETFDHLSTHPYFVERGVYPNIDGLSWFFMDKLGFPENMYTPLFGLARTAGWTAHHLETLKSKLPISRPPAIIAPKKKASL